MIEFIKKLLQALSSTNQKKLNISAIQHSLRSFKDYGTEERCENIHETQDEKIGSK